MLHCSQNNPFRVADWRWHRALGRLEATQPAPTRRRDGASGHKWIRDAIRFKQELDACDNDLQKLELSERRPEIFWAWWAWQNDTNPMKWVMESHLLARADNFEIGFRCGVPPLVVDAYENLFFNVREKLPHRHYILNCCMRPAVGRGISEREYDLLWKLYGYFYGPHMLDAVTTNFVSPVWCSGPDSVSAAIQDDAIGTMKLKASIAAKTIAVSPNTQMELLHAFTKFVEVERTTDSTGKAQDQILDHIGAMMIELPFNVGGRDPRNDHKHITSPLDEFEESAVELTYAETMRLSVGGTVPDAATLLALTFPEEIRPTPQLLEAGGSDEQKAQ